jgi:DnaJ-class molecular chaperone
MPFLEYQDPDEYPSSRDPKYVTCPSCNGSRWFGEFPDHQMCSYCNGSGRVIDN